MIIRITRSTRVCYFISITTISTIATMTTITVIATAVCFSCTCRCFVSVVVVYYASGMIKAIAAATDPLLAEPSV